MFSTKMKFSIKHLNGAFALSSANEYDLNNSWKIKSTVIITIKKETNKNCILKKGTIWDSKHDWYKTKRYNYTHNQTQRVEN